MTSSDKTTSGSEPAARPPAPGRPARGTRRIVAAVALTLGVVVATAGLTAVALDGDDDVDDAARDRDRAGAQVVETVETAALISSDDAIRAALEATGGGQVVDLDLDDERGTAVYEIEVRPDPPQANVEIDVVVDARTGAVLATAADAADDPDDLD